MPCRLQPLVTFRRLDPEDKGIMIFPNVYVCTGRRGAISGSPCVMVLNVAGIKLTGNSVTRGTRVC
jgi:hypothetical protein